MDVLIVGRIIYEPLTCLNPSGLQASADEVVSDVVHSCIDNSDPCLLSTPGLPGWRLRVVVYFSEHVANIFGFGNKLLSPFDFAVTQMLVVQL
jgi:hypothetical protein